MRCGWEADHSICISRACVAAILICVTLLTWTCLSCGDAGGERGAGVGSISQTEDSQTRNKVEQLHSSSSPPDLEHDAGTRRIRDQRTYSAKNWKSNEAFSGRACDVLLSGVCVIMRRAVDGPMRARGSAPAANWGRAVSWPPRDQQRALHVLVDWLRSWSWRQTAWWPLDTSLAHGVMVWNCRRVCSVTHLAAVCNLHDYILDAWLDSQPPLCPILPSRLLRTTYYYFYFTLLFSAFACPSASPRIYCDV